MVRDLRDMTLIPFNPSGTAIPPFQTKVTLDGSSYFLTATWNVYGQRWYMAITDQYNNLILMIPIIGSPLNNSINLVFGYFFVSTLVYRADTGNFEVNP